MDKKFFEGKYCKIEQKNGFILYGKVSNVTEDHFWFTSKQRTGMFAWTAVNSIVEH